MTEASYIQVCVVNANRVDFDRAIDWSILSPAVKVFHDDLGVNPTDDDIILRCAPNTEVLVTKEIAISAACIMQLPLSVRMICEAGTGYNNIDLQACRERDIQVRNVPSYSEAAVASLVITFLLNLSCGMKQSQAELLEGNRDRFYRGLPYDTCFEVEGKVLGLIGGSGKIGSRVAAIAVAMNMRVIISSRSIPSVDGSSSNSDRIEYTTSIDYLLENSDYVSLHCPLNTETKDIINAESLKKMKKSAYLINTARGIIDINTIIAYFTIHSCSFEFNICALILMLGGLVDEVALIDALEHNVIAGAGLDVQVREPPFDKSPLYTLKNVILTPHIGWKRKETRQRLVHAVSMNIKSYLNGGNMNVV